MSNNPFDMLYKRDVSFNLVILVVKQTTESAAVHKILKGEKCESVLTQVASSSQSTSAKRLNVLQRNSFYIFSKRVIQLSDTG